MSRVDAVWAVFSYVVTDVVDNAVVGAKSNSSRHPWQAKIPSSGEFYEPTCFVVANLREASALSTLVGVIALRCWLGVCALSPCSGFSTLGRCLVVVTLRGFSGVRSAFGRWGKNAFYRVTKEGAGFWWLCEVPDGVP